MLIIFANIVYAIIFISRGLSKEGRVMGPTRKAESKGRQNIYFSKKETDFSALCKF